MGQKAKRQKIPGTTKTVPTPSQPVGSIGAAQAAGQIPKGGGKVTYQDGQLATFTPKTGVDVAGKSQYSAETINLLPQQPAQQPLSVEDIKAQMLQDPNIQRIMAQQDAAQAAQAAAAPAGVVSDRKAPFMGEGVMEKIASAGLLPGRGAALLAQDIKGLLGLEKKEIPAPGEMAKTTMGKILGLATIATTSALIGAGVINYIQSAAARDLVINPLTGNYVTNKILANYATPQMAGNILNRVLGSSPQTKILMGILGLEAASLTMGLWGSAEAPEPISYLLRDARQYAERTGDWSIFDKATQLANEFTNPSLIEKIITYSPVGVIQNILKKAAGIREGVFLQTELANAIKREQAAGTDPNNLTNNIFAQGRIDQTNAEKVRVDYFNQQRTFYDQQQRDAENADMREDAEFWRKQREESYRLEEIERKKVMEFWIAYRKEIARMNEDNSPSHLNFGLLK